LRAMTTPNPNEKGSIREAMQTEKGVGNSGKGRLFGEREKRDGNCPKLLSFSLDKIPKKYPLKRVRGGGKGATMGEWGSSAASGFVLAKGVPAKGKKKAVVKDR